MSRRSFLARTLACAAACWVVPAGAADATNPDGAESKAACVDAYEGGQRERSAKRLLAARSAFERCASGICKPQFARDCTRWLKELAAAIPSVVVVVEDATGPITDARVYADGELFAERADGTAHPIDPGERTFRVEVGGKTATRRVVITEGKGHQEVRFDWSGAGQAASASVAPAPVADRGDRIVERPTPWPVYALLGLGAAGLGTGLYFGLSAVSDENELETRCKPNCTDSELDPVDRKYAVAWIAGGIGVLSLAGAAVLYIARPEKERPGAALVVGPTPSGGYASLSGTF